MRLSSSLRLPAMGALLAASLMVAGPAAAAGTGGGFAPYVNAGRWVGGPHTNSGNWAGYAATGATFTSISGSWTEPKANCKADHDLYAPWVGIDGYNDSTVEQTGVQTSCSTGSPVDSGWYEMYPANPVYYSEPVSTGDQIDASVTFNGGSSYTLTLEDATQGWTKTVTKSLSADNASAEAIIEAPGGFPGLPNGVSFTNVEANGKPLGDFSTTKLTSAGFTPGALSGGNFTITHK
jgi:Peptidase A4 family